jgi:hypothetical protein
MAPSVHPIHDENLGEFCEFLHENLNPGIPLAQWRQAFSQRWSHAKPNNGFLLREPGGRIVGGIGAIYADRSIRGGIEKVCNITSWCVLEEFRSHSLRLAMALVSQPGFHFTDLSPTPVVAGFLRFLKFKQLDSRTIVMPNLPWWAPGVRVIVDPQAIVQALTPEDAKTFLDHHQFPWLRHVVVGRRSSYCHIVYKKSVLKRLPCASVLHTSDPALFLRYRWTLGSWFLVRHGMVTTRMDARLLTRKPRWSTIADGYSEKVFRSDTLAESDITYAYTETVALDL